MMVVGTDTHKGSHMLVGLDYGTGRERGQRQITADDAGHLAAIRWARGLDHDVVWAIEDCRHVSYRLEQALIAAGERVLRVAPHRMGASRKREREPGKSDPIDARAVAHAVLADGIEAFPEAFLDDRAMEIRQLSDHRRVLVRQRTQAISRLRWQLVNLDPDLERSITPRACDSARTRARIRARLRRVPERHRRVRIARAELEDIDRLTETITALTRELRDLILHQCPRLLAEQGCGPIVAAILIGHTAGVRRFRRRDASLAMLAGAAPIPCSSGKKVKHRLNRGGDRQLNYALHVIAITRARHDPQTQAYLAHRLAQGDTPKGALRCLKRILARHIYRLLTEEPAPSHAIIPITAAPTRMACT